MSSFCGNCGTANINLPGVEALIAKEVLEADLVPGVAKTVIDETVLAGKFRTLTSCQLSCLQPGKVKVIHTPSGGSAKRIGSGRVGPGKGRDFDFSWFPFVTIAPAGNVKVIFTLFSWATASDVEAFLQNTLDDV